MITRLHVAAFTSLVCVFAAAANADQCSTHRPFMELAARSSLVVRVEIMSIKYHTTGIIVAADARILEILRGDPGFTVISILGRRDFYQKRLTDKHLQVGRQYLIIFDEETNPRQPIFMCGERIVSYEEGLVSGKLFSSGEIESTSIADIRRLLEGGAQEE